MNSNYARGQETFINRLMVTIHNLFILMIASVLTGIFASSVILWKNLPDHFWIGQKHIFSISNSIFRKGGLLSVPQSAEYYLTSSLENYDLFQKEIHDGLVWGGMTGFIFFIVTGIFFVRRGKIMTNTKILRGTQLLSPRQFNENYKAALKKCNRINIFNPSTYRNKRYKTMMGNPFICGEDRLIIPEDSLYRHMAVLGSTGVGKTTLINDYLDYCRCYGEKVIIPDINAEYASRFYKEGDIILSLTDPNTSYWDFSCEPIPNEQFAQYLVPTGNEQNSFWWKGARAVLSQLLAKTATGEELWDLINNQNKDLTDSLSGIARKISGAQGTGQAAGITGSTVLDLCFLQHLNAWPKERNDRSGFSLYKWAQDQEPNWVFITFSDSDKSSMGPLLRIWINLAILGLFERKSTDIPPLNVVIDELNSIGQIELLPAAVERARKYGGKVVLGYQSDSQLRHVYGYQADSIKTNTGNKFIFRTPDTKDSHDLANFLGRSEVLQPHLSSSYGLSGRNDRENIGEQRSINNPVLDSELRALPDGVFFLRSLYMDPVRSQVLFRPRISSCYQTEFGTPSPRKNDTESDNDGIFDETMMDHGNIDGSGEKSFSVSL